MNHTDSELIEMAKSDDSHIRDEVHRIVIEQGRGGRYWAKCPHCGEIYPMDRDRASACACSDECWDGYIASLGRAVKGKELL